jgi:asparagine synthase (glutamine-hydrolysing)
MVFRDQDGLSRMCGLAAELRLDGDRPDVPAVTRMAATMTDRGPDAGGVWSQGPLAFGHRRLSIIDLSRAGDQPMHDHLLGRTVVFNGCIYNHEQLRTELERAGHTFGSTSDTEVLLKAHAEWGDGFVQRLQGMFAFVLHERESGRTLLGRDRFGIKPLYLDERADLLRVASTPQALLAGGGVDTSIDPVALHHYLTFHAVVPPPRTILRGIRELPPATTLAIEADGRRTTTEYWRPDFTRDPDRADWSARDWEDATEEVLRQAVRARLVADVDVGVLLSGGLDSSLVVGLLAEHGQQGLQTFSIGFETVGETRGDEFEFSDVIAREFDTDHHRIRISTDRMVPALSRAIGAMTEPMVSHDAVAFLLLSEEVSRHVKVVQSGQGADEVFAGYHWYPPMADLGDAPLAEVGVQRAVDTYRQAFFDADLARRNQLLQPQWRTETDHPRRFVTEHFTSPGAETAVDAALRLDSQVMLVQDPVQRVDAMTMAHGLEARVPFLDHRVLDLAGRIPPALKLAQGGKGVLKEVGRRVIPSEVIDRPKGYFPVPAITHLDGPVLTLVKDALTDPAAVERGLYDPGQVDELLDDPDGHHTPLRGNVLWQLALLELWLQEHT